MQVQLNNPETYVLELIDALGGDVQVGEVRSLIGQGAVLKRLPAILRVLQEHGLVRRYVVGRYALTLRGRAALKTPRDLAVAS